MFNNVISSLTSLLPKYFIFGSYVPTLMFFFFNGVLLYGNAATVRSFVVDLQPGGLAIGTSILFFGSIVFAYVLSSISAFLRDVLEGKHWPSFLEGPLSDRQADLLKKLESVRQTSRDEAASVRDAEPRWNELMDAAAAEGREKNRGQVGYNPSADPAGKKLRALRRSMSTVRYADLETLVTLFANALKKYDINENPRLDEDSAQIESAFSEARDALNAKVIDSYIERHSRFGAGVAAPTKMGNIAAAIRDYAFGRYGFDLDALWSRFLLVIQRTDEKGYGSLLDAKTQLDFLIASYWLTLATTLCWLVALAAAGSSPATFIVLAVGGPIAAAAYHSLATTNYLAYGSVVRATVDLYRFTLLRELHLPLPSSLRQERVLWDALRGVALGNPIELGYEHPAAPS